MKCFKKIIAAALILTLALSLFGCGNKDNLPDSYGVGLQKTGYYVNWDKHELTAPDFTKFEVKTTDVLEWCVKDANLKDIDTVDKYVYEYCNQFLTNLGIADREIVEDGYLVTVDMSFYIDDKLLEDYVSTDKTYKASKDGDEIIKGFIGHKINDEYESDYTFPADDQEFPSKQAKVKIKIKDIYIESPMEQDLTEENFKKIQELVPGATDKESLQKLIRPLLAEAMLTAYMQYAIQNMEGYNPPQEYVEYELQRFKYRVNQVGYTYDAYLTEAKTTDSEVRLYCSQIAKENCIYLVVFESINHTITEQNMKDFYGDNYEFMIEAQGIEYLTLDLIRQLAIEKIAQDVILKDENGQVVDTRGDMFTPDSSDSNATESTAPTESSTESSESPTEQTTEPSATTNN